MSKGYSGALCGECVEWVTEVVLCPVRRFYVCCACAELVPTDVIDPVIPTLQDKVEGA